MPQRGLLARRSHPREQPTRHYAFQVGTDTPPVTAADDSFDDEGEPYEEEWDELEIAQDGRNCALR